jgi:hypothetical protein
MDHHEAHFRIVDRALCRTTPCFFCRLVVRENSDRLDCTRIELENAGVPDPTAEDKMKFAHAATRSGMSLSFKLVVEPLEHFAQPLALLC